jgi:hypothetical protein
MSLAAPLQRVRAIKMGPEDIRLTTHLDVTKDMLERVLVLLPMLRPAVDAQALANGKHFY